jgi:hypothetical protein
LHPTDVLVGKKELHAPRQTGIIILLELLAGLVVIAAIGFGVLYERLRTGPLALDFLVAPIEKAINRELAGFGIKIGGAVVEKLPASRSVGFRLVDVSLLGRQGELLAQTPRVAVKLSGKALLRGKLAPAKVDFIGPKLTFLHSEKSGFSLSLPMSSAYKSKNSTTSGEQVNFIKTVSDIFTHAREEQDAYAYLTKFGVKRARVQLDHNGKQSLWQIPDFTIDLAHYKKHSTLQGYSDASPETGQWKLHFKVEQGKYEDGLKISAFVKDFVPKELSNNFPGLGMLGAFDLPFTVTANMRVSTKGELTSANARISHGAGFVLSPSKPKKRVLLDEGDVILRYDGKDGSLELLPSKILWGHNQVTLRGKISPSTSKGVWKFALQTTEAQFGVDRFGLSPVPVDKMFVQGSLDVGAGRMDIARLFVESDGAWAEFNGRITAAPLAPAIRLSGEFSPMPIAVFKRLWPRLIGFGAWKWVGKNITAGRINGGKVEIDMPAGLLHEMDQGAEVPPEAIQVVIRASDLDVNYITGTPPLTIPKAAVHISGRKLVAQADSGYVILPSGRKMTMTGGRFFINDFRPAAPDGRLEISVSGSASAALEMLRQKKLGIADYVMLRPEDVQSIIRGSFSVDIPLYDGVKFADMKLAGKLRATEVKTAAVFGKMAISGGAVDFGLSTKAMDVQGNLLIKGIPVRITAQHIFASSWSRQPPVTLSASLDKEALKRLGINVGNVLRGTINAELIGKNNESGQPEFRVHADLGPAEILFSEAGWRKTPGYAATLQFDIAENKKSGHTELQNFRIIGDGIAIDGWIGLGSANKPVAFYFPEFSFNVTTQMELSGKLSRRDGIWNIKANGPSYDGKQLFRSLFSSGKLAKGNKTASRPAVGINLEATIGSLSGFFGGDIRQAKIIMSKRKGRTTRLEVYGKVDGKKPVALKMKGPPTARVLQAETGDAGGVFRLLGLFPRIKGGDASLQMNLDGRGVAEQAGTLWVKDFSIEGSHMVNDFSAENAKNRKKKVQVNMLFERMRARFSIGKGQFVLHDAYMNGPLLGATLRGKIDFESQAIRMGGTYVPLYGLNSALGVVPILGDILVGRKGEGMLGITFAVQGDVSEPEILMNPASLVTPGIFRQIFELTPPKPKITPR